MNSPLRLARSRGNASQSPACSPTWEQLQPPSASPSWRLPEESVRHPFISGKRLCCFVMTERSFGFSRIHQETSPCLEIRADLSSGEIHTDTLKQRNTPGQQIALNAPNEIILIRAGYKQRHRSGQSLLDNRTLKHLFILFSAFYKQLVLLNRCRTHV